MKQEDLEKISIVGFGIVQDNKVLNQIIEILRKDNVGIVDINLTQSKIEILVSKVENQTIEKLHEKLIH